MFNHSGLFFSLHSNQLIKIELSGISKSVFLIQLSPPCTLNTFKTFQMQRTDIINVCGHQFFQVLMKITVQLTFKDTYICIY